MTRRSARPLLEEPPTEQPPMIDPNRRSGAVLTSERLSAADASARSPARERCSSAAQGHQATR